jgi:hypothetical protein
LKTTSEGFGVLVTVSMFSFLGREKKAGQGPDLAESEGKPEVQGEQGPTVAKGKNWPIARRAKRI